MSPSKAIGVVISVMILTIGLTGCASRTDAHDRCMKAGGKWSEAPLGWSCFNG